MFKRVDKILIGKDINRTASLVVGTDSDNLADGEIVVMDKNMNVLAAGSTIADTDTIYIIQGTADLFTYYDIQGNLFDGAATTGVRRFLVSDPIVGNLVRSYKGLSYSAAAQRTATIDTTGMTPVVGTEYIVRIVYKDMKEHPGQFTQTYRYISTTATLDTWGAAMAAKINAHAGRRVDATYTAGDDTLLLTGKAIPQCTTGLTDIDKYSLVDFDVAFMYVASTGVWTIWPATVTTTTYTGPEYGQGTWTQIRDMEKAAKGYIGFTNRTTFPVKEPATYTVKSATYDQIIIEHDVEYTSPDNQYVKRTPLTTVIAIPVPSSGTQMTQVLGVLNPWMASCAGGFSNVSV